MSLPPAARRIWHFLLPDPGMADYTDKVAKSPTPGDFDRLKAWRKAFCAPLDHHEAGPPAATQPAGRAPCGPNTPPPWLADRARTGRRWTRGHTPYQAAADSTAAPARVSRAQKGPSASKAC